MRLKQEIQAVGIFIKYMPRIVVCLEEIALALKSIALQRENELKSFTMKGKSNEKQHL
jgi:hypothetical protein|tara:strand:+ start:1979 stop:2152 length:174 start_codon:yes stop_codon:yes gene_type:complete